MASVDTDFGGEGLHVKTPTTVEEREAQERRAAAWRGVTARYAVDTAAGGVAAAKALPEGDPQLREAKLLWLDLRQALGIDPAPSVRAPGTCGSCGVVLPMSQASPKQGGQRVRCGPCDRGKTPAAAPVAAPTVAAAPAAEAPAPARAKRWDLNAAEYALLRDIFAGRVFRANGQDWRRDERHIVRQIGRDVHYLPPGLARLGADGVYGLTRHGEAQLGEAVPRG